ncbi:MAG: 5'/3'-nucleotidase SurE [Bacteroidota bacterium]
MNKPPRILVSNDDGIHAPGIAALVEVASEFGEVITVAPLYAQSGMGHAISLSKPLRIKEHDIFPNIKSYSVNGTPADCVKLATGVLMDVQPDLIVSGINHGYNSSVSSIYSGTLSAAREGAIQGIPSIGFSLGDFSHEADMSAAKVAARAVLEKAIAHQLRPGQLLNVNVPYLPIEEIKGIKIVRMAMGRWVEEFAERVDPYGRKYYWLTGNFSLQDEGEDTDIHALEDGYVSVTPMTHDLTQYQEIAPLTQWHFELKK